MPKVKYQKPVGRIIKGISGAEGACFNTGGTPYGTACTSGVTTDACAPGTTATAFPLNFCNSGGDAANCFMAGTDAYG